MTALTKSTRRIRDPWLNPRTSPLSIPADRTGVIKLRSVAAMAHAFQAGHERDLARAAERFDALFVTALAFCVATFVFLAI